VRREVLASWRRWLGMAMACLFLTACDQSKTEVVEREIGYRGKARQNPFLAAERLMEGMSHEVKRIQSFSELPKRDATVITPVQSFVTYGDRELALAWVKRGGHLIVMLAGAEQWQDDWGMSWTDIFKKKARDEEEERFLKEIGVKGVSESKVALAQIKVRGREYTAEMGGEIEFERAPAGIDVRSGDALVSFRRGSGRITLIASAKPFRNVHLGPRSCRLAERTGDDGGAQHGVVPQRGAHFLFAHALGARVDGADHAGGAVDFLAVAESSPVWPDFYAGGSLDARFRGIPAPDRSVPLAAAAGARAH
jgi:hypothetical protein